MKYRSGFVSNSSSTSFCIYGVCFENINEAKREALDNESMYSVYDYDGDRMWVGRSWSAIGDDETGKQFKESTEQKIQQIAQKNNLPITSFETYEETISS